MVIGRYTKAINATGSIIDIPVDVDILHAL